MTSFQPFIYHWQFKGGLWLKLCCVVATRRETCSIDSYDTYLSYSLHLARHNTFADAIFHLFSIILDYSKQAPNSSIPSRFTSAFAFPFFLICHGNRKLKVMAVPNQSQNSTQQTIDLQWGLSLYQNDSSAPMMESATEVPIGPLAQVWT